MSRPVPRGRSLLTSQGPQVPACLGSQGCSQRVHRASKWGSRGHTGPTGCPEASWEGSFPAECLLDSGPQLLTSTHSLPGGPREKRALVGLQPWPTWEPVLHPGEAPLSSRFLASATRGSVPSGILSVQPISDQLESGSERKEIVSWSGRTLAWGKQSGQRVPISFPFPVYFVPLSMC